MMFGRIALAASLVLTMGIPPMREYVIPTHAVDKMVSIASILLLVTLPYTAPKVSVGATTEMKTRRVTATVLWNKVSHLLNPMSSDSPLEIFDNSTAPPNLRLVQMNVSGTFDQFGVRG
jgi:hypothetical protein